MGQLLKHFDDNATIRALGLRAQDIIDLLEPEQIGAIMTELGAESSETYSNHMVFPTICHNPYGEENSMKLYYYYNNKIFKCYTGDESYNIIGLISAIKEVNDIEWSYQDTVNFLLPFLDLDNFVPSETAKERYTSILSNYRDPIEAPYLPEINKKILARFSNFYTGEWKREGISDQTHWRFSIKYFLGRNAIIIPHFGLGNRLLGIRVRNLDYEKNPQMAKYMPLVMEKKIYNHPLSANLYGLNENWRAIEESKKVYLFEGEKSVLLHYEYYGKDSNAVAVCGNSLNIIQFRLLQRNFPVEELIFCFDKEYDKWGDEESLTYYNKLKKMGERFLPYARVSLILDDEGLLKKKDAPIDRGKEVFERLVSRKLYLR